MGVKFCTNTKIGRDITLNQLRENCDAVLVASGAWENAKLNCPGEELEGVLGAVDFLRDVDKFDFKGYKVAVVGGGDIAMDACRTSVRLGADTVYNIYRRTIDEMPANKIEIAEAGEEGVIFKNLANPIEIIGDEGKAKAIRLQAMELGEPDASGRRSPAAVLGKEETIKIDAVIVAIGQKPNGFGFEEIEKTKWGTIFSDGQTFKTNLEGVFASVPGKELSASQVIGQPVLDIAALSGLCASKSEARRLLQQGGLSINQLRVSDPAATVAPEMLIEGRIMVLRSGKKAYCLVKTV
jgi:formate dehydrogenase major subunit